MKHRTYSLTALFLALLTVSSCASSAPISDSDAQDSTTPAPDVAANDRLTELGERDFQGAVFTILDDAGNLNVNHPDETLEGEIVNEAIVERNHILSEKYNIEFDYRTGNGADGRAQLVRNSVMSNDNEYDLFFSILPTSIAPLATEGILADLCAMDSLSLDAAWWSPLVYENCRIGGRMYYTTGDISPISFRAAACYYANETLLEQYQIDKADIYSAVLDGAWTLDRLNSLAGELDLDLNEDGAYQMDDDFFGILNEIGELTGACFMASSGVNLSSIDKDGKLYANLSDEKAISAVEKIASVLSCAPKRDNNAHHIAFKEDRVVFLMHYASSGYTRYRDMASNYIMLPLPKYDEKQESYRSLINTWCNCFVAVPTTADTERAGFLMEAMAYLSQDIVRPAAYDMAMKVKGVRNEQDSAMLDTIMNSLYLDFNSFMNFGGSLTPISNAIFNGASYTSAIAGITESMNAAMEQFSKAWIGEEG